MVLFVESKNGLQYLFIFEFYKCTLYAENDKINISIYGGYQLLSNYWFNIEFSRLFLKNVFLMLLSINRNQT